MTILEAIKKAEELQKERLGTATVYIRRKNWLDLIDPIDFVWVNGENGANPFKFISTFEPTKESLLSNDWTLFIHYFKSQPNKKEPKLETTTISKENIKNSINQIMLAKISINEMFENAEMIVKAFQNVYGINFNDFVERPELIIDKETRFLYLFTKLAMTYGKNINDCLDKIIIELGGSEKNKASEKPNDNK